MLCPHVGSPPPPDSHPGTLPTPPTVAACRQSELDMHKGEANRLRREMERVEGERERLREEARRWGGS